MLAPNHGTETGFGRMPHCRCRHVWAAKTGDLANCQSLPPRLGGDVSLNWRTGELNVVRSAVRRPPGESPLLRQGKRRQRQRASDRNRDGSRHKPLHLDLVDLLENVWRQTDAQQQLPVVHQLASRRDK